MSKFKRHSRFDTDLAETGVWFSVKDELGNHYGDFLCSLIDQHATHTKLRAQRATKGRPDRQGQNTDAAKVVAELLVTLSVTDWEGVCYADGKPHRMACHAIDNLFDPPRNPPKQRVAHHLAIGRIHAIELADRQQHHRRRQPRPGPHAEPGDRLKESMTAARRGASLRPMKKAKAAPKPASAQKRRSRWISIPLKVAIGFVGLSVGTVVIYRFVPPPVTITMLLDPNGITKEWKRLDAIDRLSASSFQTAPFD